MTVFTYDPVSTFATTNVDGTSKDIDPAEVATTILELQRIVSSLNAGTQHHAATLSALNGLSGLVEDDIGRVYDDGSNNGIYKRVSSTWVLLGPLDGAVGPQGPQGAQGEAGTPADDATVTAGIEDATANFSETVAGTADKIVGAPELVAYFDSRKAGNATVIEGTDDTEFVTPLRLEGKITARLNGAAASAVEAAIVGSTDQGFLRLDRFNTAFVARRANITQVEDGTATNLYVAPQQLLGYIAGRFADFDQSRDIDNGFNFVSPQAVTRMIDLLTADRATAIEVDSVSTDLMSVERFYEAFNELRAFKADIDVGLTGTASEKQIVTPSALIGHIEGRIASFSEAVDATNNTSLMTPLQVRNATFGLEIDRADVEAIPSESRSLVTGRRFHDGFSARRANNVTTNEGTSIDHYITPAQLARVRGIDQAAFQAGDVAVSIQARERDWIISGGVLSPGELAEAFTSSPLGGIDAPDVGGVTATGARGKVRRFTGSSICALRATYSVADDELYSARVRLARSVDPSDPSGDAVNLKVSWLNPEGVLQGTTTVEEWANLLISDGVQSTTILIGEDATTLAQGDVIGLEPPTGAVKFALYTQTFGTDGQTDVEKFRILPFAPEARNISVTQNVTQTVTTPTDTLTNVAASIAGFDVAITADEPSTPGFAIDEGRTVRMQIPTGGEGLGGLYTLKLGALDVHPIVSSDGSALLADTFVAGELINLTFTGSAWRAIGSRLSVDIRNLKNNVRTPVTEFGVIMDSPSSAAINAAAMQVALDADTKLGLPKGNVISSEGLWYGDQANIEGEGKNVSAIRLADGASAEILLGDKRHRDNISNHVFGGILSDFALDGNRDGGATCTALLTPRSWQNQLRNLRIDNSSGFGIWIPATTANGITAAEGKTQGSIWDGLDVRDNAGYGIWSENTEANDVFFQGSPTVNGNGDLGMQQIRLGSCGGWKIDGMHLFGTPADYQGSSAILLDSGRNLIINRCNFDNDKPAGAPGGTLAILELGAFNMSQITISNTVMRHEGADEAGNTYYFIVVRGSTGRNQLNMTNVAFAAGNNFEGFSNAELKVIHSEGGTLDGIIDAVTFQGITEDQWGDLQQFPQCQTRHNSVGGHGVPTQENPTINSYGGSVPGVVDLDDLSDPTHPLNTTKKVLGTIYTHPINGRKMECLPPLSANSNWTYLGTDEVAVSPR